MKKLLRIFRYIFSDLVRSKWTVGYFLFFLLTGFVLFSFSKDALKTVTSLLNIVLIIVPMISIILGSVYFYNVREFIDLLLSQPIGRGIVFTGIYLGLAASLSSGFVSGILLSMLISGVHVGSDIDVLLILVGVGILLTSIFTALSVWISISNQNKIKGIALSVFLWLFMALLYDGIFLLWIIVFGDYPVEKHAIMIALLNPIDLSRIMVLLKLDTSALMGYTGAVFQNFLGTSKGLIVTGIALAAWLVIPCLGMMRTGSQKDF